MDFEEMTDEEKRMYLHEYTGLSPKWIEYVQKRLSSERDFPQTEIHKIKIQNKWYTFKCDVQFVINPAEVWIRVNGAVFAQNRINGENLLNAIKGLYDRINKVSVIKGQKINSRIHDLTENGSGTRSASWHYKFFIPITEENG